MVMHARKHPRLNDGYYERSQSHQFEDKYSSHTDRNRYNNSNKNSPSFPRVRAESTPNRPSPQNKSAFVDRSSAVRYDKDRRPNHQTPQRGADGRHTNHERLHDGGGNKDRNHKEDIQKTALLICGKWSEHISSSGKRYFYDCDSGVSQWEKPKDWKDSAAVKPRKDSKSSHAVKDDRARHTIGSTDNRNGRPINQQGQPITAFKSKGGSSSKEKINPAHQRARQIENRKREAGHRDGNAPPSKRPATNHNTGYNGVKHSRTEDGKDTRQTEDMDISPEVTPPVVNSHQGGGHHNSIPTTSTSSTHHSHTNNQQSSNKHVSGSRSSSHNHHNTSRSGNKVRLPTTITGNHEELAAQAAQLGLTGGVDKQELTQQAIQTIVKLQQALLAQQQQHLKALAEKQHKHRQTVLEQRKLEPDPELEHTDDVQAQQLKVQGSQRFPGTNASSRPERRDTVGESPRSNHSERSKMADEDDASCSSSQRLSANMSLSAMTAAARQKESLPQLTPSLSNYYKEVLVDHVTCWQGDQVDRQANLYGQESHTVGSLHCTQVSVDLKRQRSVVRINEIETTLQDQRVLFLAQQIKELENMRSQTSFIPTKPQIQPYNTPSSSSPMQAHDSTPPRDMSAQNSPLHESLSHHGSLQGSPQGSLQGSLQGTPVHDEIHEVTQHPEDGGYLGLESMTSPVSSHSDGDGLGDELGDSYNHMGASEDSPRNGALTNCEMQTPADVTTDCEPHDGYHSDHSMHEDTGGGSGVDIDQQDNRELSNVPKDRDLTKEHMRDSTPITNNSIPTTECSTKPEGDLCQASPSDEWSSLSEAECSPQRDCDAPERRHESDYPREDLEAGEISDDDDDLPMGQPAHRRISTELIESEEEEGEVSSVCSSPDTRTVHIARDKQQYNDSTPPSKNGH